jgi:DNA-binding phage protein
MPLTRDFKETIQERARHDAALREALSKEAVDALLSGDVETGKTVLRDNINATVGFDKLATVTKKSSKSLMRMLGPKGNPQARNFFEIVAYLQKKEGLCLRVRSA